MKVVSSLADIEFRIGRIERRGNKLLVHSHVEQSMQSTVYVAPQDVLVGLGRILVSPGAWLFILGLPVFYIREKLQSGKQGKGRASGRGGWNTPDNQGHR